MMQLQFAFFVHINVPTSINMASRDGPMARASDGSDYIYREKVADRYIISLVNKKRFKFTAFLHFLLTLLMVCRLAGSFFVIFGLRPHSFLQKLSFPRAQAWEYVWLFSILSTIFGLLALKRNRSFLMQQFLIGILVFGFGPVCWAMYDMSDDMLSYYVNRETKQMFLGFPWVALCYIFFVIAIQVHFFGLLFAWNCLKAWNAGTAGRKKLH